MNVKLLLAIIISIPLMYACFKLALQLFGMRASRRTIEKLIGIEIVALLLIEVVGINFEFTELISFAGGLILWIILVKRLSLANYSAIRAVGSFIFGYLLAIIFAITAAVVLVNLFPV
jgi:hypothetical protein